MLATAAELYRHVICRRLGSNEHVCLHEPVFITHQLLSDYMCGEMLKNKRNKNLLGACGGVAGSFVCSQSFFFSRLVFEWSAAESCLCALEKQQR